MREVAVFAVNAACLVPPAALDEGVGTTSAFRRRHEKVRDQWTNWVDEEPVVAPYDGPLAFEPDRIGGASDADLDTLVASLSIDHALPPSAMLPGGRDEALKRIHRLTHEVLPAYVEASPRVHAWPTPIASRGREYAVSLSSLRSRRSARGDGGHPGCRSAGPAGN